MLRVLDSMSFHKFIEERGPPFRSCDIFDEVYVMIYDQLKCENDPITSNSSTAIFEHIKELGNQLLLNVKKRNFYFEFFRKYFFLFKKIHHHNKLIHRKFHNHHKLVGWKNNLPEFPHLDKELVNAAIKEGIKKQQNSR